MFAAVDLGSNSFRLHVGLHDGEAIRIVRSARDPVRLAAGLDSKGFLTEQAMHSALECLKNFRAILAGYTLDAVRVVGTNTLRVAKNAAAFLPAAEQAIGYPIEIISGEEEGRLIYMGVASVLASDEKRLVIDIGGGSTELIVGKGYEILEVESFSIGTVGQGQSFFPGGRIEAEAFDAAILSARSVFEDGAPPFRPQHWNKAYGSSGTIRALSEAIEKNGIGDGSLSLKNLEALKAVLIGYGDVASIDLVGIKSERMSAVVGGLSVLIGIMRELGIKAITAIDAGLRMGVLRDLQLRATRHDRREESVREFMRRFRADEDRATRVAATAATLYAQLRPASDDHAKHLYWSGLLHEVGMIISHTGYHKHAAYMVENADLPGFTTREQHLMSTLIAAHKGNLRKVKDELDDADFAKAVLALRLAVMLLHSRLDAEADRLKLKMKNRIELEFRRDWSAQHPTLSYWIEKERDSWGEVGVNLDVKMTG